jgi:hypothetical protein
VIVTVENDCHLWLDQGADTEGGDHMKDVFTRVELEQGFAAHTPGHSNALVENPFEVEVETAEDGE